MSRHHYKGEYMREKFRSLTASLAEIIALFRTLTKQVERVADALEAIQDALQGMEEYLTEEEEEEVDGEELRIVGKDEWMPPAS